MMREQFMGKAEEELALKYFCERFWNEKSSSSLSGLFCFVLFCFVLFCFVLFCLNVFGLFICLFFCFFFFFSFHNLGKEQIKKVIDEYENILQDSPHFSQLWEYYARFLFSRMEGFNFNI